MVWTSAVIVTIAMLVSGMQFYYLLMPMSHWILYDDVVPVSDIDAGEYPRFLSVLEVFEGKVNLKYNDILFCKMEGEDTFTYYSEYKSNSYGKRPVGKEYNEWRYGHPVNRPGECYLKSNIVLKLPFGVERVQTIMGESFRVR